MSAPGSNAGSVKLVVFRLDEQRYALPLEEVEHIVRAVEVTALANVPPLVLGMINCEGRVLPVLNIRKRFGLAEREVTPEDQFLIAHAGPRTVVLMIDEAHDVIERSPREIFSASEIVPGLEHIQGVTKLNDGLVLIHDLEKFLSLEAADALDEAMKEEAAK